METMGPSSTLGLHFEPIAELKEEIDANLAVTIELENSTERKAMKVRTELKISRTLTFTINVLLVMVLFGFGAVQAPPLA
ncbi:hypothetical protein [Pelagicoccus sp. SDUM812002]|uniref:hypothetical protein n=1 Tax=Pelagicoccus sp. SDUM812002 TaxID=3041266 RepID=UPI0028118BB3|nr:hypothetical protein [Pelagicoccus sp. SDUM812002]